MRPALFVDAATHREFHRRRRALWRMPEWERGTALAELHVWVLEELRRGHGGWWLVPGPTPDEVRLVALARRLAAEAA